MTKKERNAARGQECTLRIAALAGYGGCASTETTVLAHAPCRDKGTGFKSPDRWGAFACATCHDLVDGRSQPKQMALANGITVDRQELRTIYFHYIQAKSWLIGIYETQKIQGVFDE